MNIIQKTIKKLDAWQQRQRLLGFVYAVIKKYSEDQAGYQAALLTYYAFLSLFPLLLIVTTLTDSIANSHPKLQADIIKSTTDYFPVLGNQLASHVHSLHRNGVALVAGILFTFYGTRGVADAFRHGVCHIWRVPLKERDSFPRSIIKTFSIVIVGGLGFVAAAVAAGLANAAGHGVDFRLLSLVVNVFILFWLFTFLLNVSLPKHVSIKGTRSGALTAALGLVILQSLGGYLLARELKHLDALYSYFALSLGLLFWIYLQSQVLYYAVEIGAVKAHKLWPRSMSDTQPTKADEQMQSLAAGELGA